ncbi:MAG: DinB family protein [Gemmatimonadales bacterium]
MDELQRLFEYNRWATRRLLDAAEALRPEDLRRDLKSSFPSVLDTLTHMIGAEWVWLERWKGRSPTAFLDTAALDSIRAVRLRFDGLWREQQGFLDGLENGDETRDVAYKTFKGEADQRPLAELIRHIVNHATYHRGQVVTMLRQLGVTPPPTDYVRWLREGT